MTKREDIFYNKIVGLLLSDTIVIKGDREIVDEVYISFPYSYLYGRNGFDYDVDNVMEWGDDGYRFQQDSKEMIYLMNNYGLNEGESEEVLNRYTFEVYKIVKDMYEL